MAHILPHWNRHDRVGQGAPIKVYTSRDEVGLFLNGHSSGRKNRGDTDFQLVWDVKYEP